MHKSLDRGPGQPSIATIRAMQLVKFLWTQTKHAQIAGRVDSRCYSAVFAFHRWSFTRLKRSTPLHEKVEPSEWSRRELLSRFRRTGSPCESYKRNYEKVRSGKGEWKTAYTVAALPFSDCSVQAGRWDWRVSTFAGVTVLGYVTSRSAADIEKKIATKALSAAKRSQVRRAPLPDPLYLYCTKMLFALESHGHTLRPQYPIDSP